MKVKIFTPDSNGRISFTKDELEELLNSMYQDGYDDGKKSVFYTYTPSITTTGTPPTIKYDNITC